MLNYPTDKHKVVGWTITTKKIFKLSSTTSEEQYDSANFSQLNPMNRIIDASQTVTVQVRKSLHKYLGDHSGGCLRTVCRRNLSFTIQWWC